MKRLFFILIFFLFCKEAYPQLLMDFETGYVFTQYNDVGIPGDTGTKFSLTDDLSTDSQIFYRIRGGYGFLEKHHIYMLYAPLLLKAEGRINKDIVFQNYTYPSGTDIKANYKFNSYRITYTYDIFKNNTFIFSLGPTVKVRDAYVKIEGNGVEKEKKNIGVVPLIHVSLQFIINSKLSIVLDGDGLASKQGRAEDFLFAFQFSPFENLALKLGYRILEGGADNSEVYTFTMLHYAVIGAVCYF